MDFWQTLRRAFEPRLVWSTALYVQEQPASPGAPLGAPWQVLNARRIDFFGRYPHTYADPFLFLHGGALYIFLEIVKKGGHGEIVAYRTTDLQKLEDLGIVFSTSFHLSYPFVFENESSIYMIPEAGKTGSLSLYQFDQFPFNLRKVRTLLEGNFFDSHLFRQYGVWFLFTTVNDDLQLYTSNDLLSDEFRPHPASPITSDTKISRSAGSVLRFGGCLYRVAQDCSTAYGQNVSLIEIRELSPVAYQERVVIDRLFALDNSWNTHGAHQFTVCEFLGKTVIATDGKHADFFVNRVASGLRGLLGRLWGRDANDVNSHEYETWRDWRRPLGAGTIRRPAESDWSQPVGSDMQKNRDQDSELSEMARRSVDDKRSSWRIATPW
jgi:hypothetical protein